MTDEELLKGLSNCKSIADAYRLIGEDPAKNGTYLKNKLNSILYPLGLNADMFSKSNLAKTRYEMNPKHCLNCGTKIPYERRGGKFCNSSCAASYNNKKNGPKSDETKRNISSGIRKYLSINSNSITNKNYISVHDAIEEDLIDNPFNIEEEKIKVDFLVKDKIKKRICSVCKKEFNPYILETGKLYKGKTCSKECREEMLRIAGKKAIEVSKERGTWKTWQSRNTTSYAEKFWIEVLDNNNISYTREFFYDKKYFLDFMIVKNGKILDLEIDGHQHIYDERKEHDQERDEYLTKHNVIVYRIPWNCLNNDNGKEKMKIKIEDFLKFYNEL